MILKKDAEKLKKARGVSIRYNNELASSIQLAFTYKGVQCRETVGYQVNQQGMNSASNMLGEIKNKIAKGTFFYADYFPKSKKLELFGGAVTGATVKDYVDRYIENAEERGLAPSTVTGYKKSRNGLKPLWLVKVTELDQLMLVNFVKASSTKVKAKTISNRLSVLRSALDDAIIDKLIVQNPAAGFKVGKHIKVESNVNARKQHNAVTPFTPNEIDKIVDASEGTVKTIIQFCNETGVRSSEWVALKKQDVCLISREVTIYEAVVEKQTKGTKTISGRRSIPISHEVAELLEEEMNKHDSEYVFLNSKGEHWNQDSFRKHQWSKVLERAEVKYRYPYQLRHTFATRNISKGMNLWKLTKLMGHKSPQQLYQHYGNFIDAYEKKSKRENAA
ncbi:tyrosine-type recombinase/integrase [Pseudoalteromonas sp. P1-8]|uniref:tyrosine-type recombinase/integrase n=1 Tax=Pseudoalteromonas sp. P1-8 TaxID=1710353 RepID=UPI0006DC6729|nr:tyrosine-type recombinase/integrase [Pseudoalteromonas sp. P1-8]KPW04799.1 Tyrosine recombinase XerC [Pseudoalteromonas sp. P1-8]